MASGIDLLNVCVEAFVERDYSRALEWAKACAEQENNLSLLSCMMLLLCAKKEGERDLLTAIGEKALKAAEKYHWERAVIALILDSADPQQVLSQACGAQQRCEFFFYYGCKQLIGGNLQGARESLDASVGQREATNEARIAKAMLEQFDELNSRVYAECDLTDGRFDNRNATVWEFGELLEKLTNEHDRGYFYRGQTQEFGTLLPSGYRAIVNMGSPPLVPQLHEKLHGRGCVFRELLPASRRPRMQQENVEFVSLCRSNFGYPLCQLFCQHCCLPSEGLDVTDDLSVATFFALFDYVTERLVGEDDRPGVIYRVFVPATPPLTLERLKRIDLYNCPFFLSGTDILGLLGTCETAEDSQRSLFSYYAKWLPETMFESDEHARFNRPLEAIEFPRNSIERGRVMAQRAGLIFPDLLLPRWFETLPVPPPKGRTWYGPHCVEDLAKSSAVETFMFRHRSNNRRHVSLDPNSVFPLNDPIRAILSIAVTAMAGSFGTPAIALTTDGTAFLPGDDGRIPK